MGCGKTARLSAVVSSFCRKAISGKQEALHREDQKPAAVTSSPLTEEELVQSQTFVFSATTAVAHLAHWPPVHRECTGCVQPTECNLKSVPMRLLCPLSVPAAGISGDGQLWLQLAALNAHPKSLRLTLGQEVPALLGQNFKALKPCIHLSVDVCLSVWPHLLVRPCIDPCWSCGCLILPK